MSNPNGIWRSAQVMTRNASKSYFRVKIDFGEMSRPIQKYFGVSHRLSGDSKWYMQPGVYFGCGRGKLASIHDPKGDPGLFLLANGRERQVLDLSLSTGDIIGIKLDTKEGMVTFDLNEKDTGVAY